MEKFGNFENVSACSFESEIKVLYVADGTPTFAVFVIALDFKMSQLSIF